MKISGAIFLLILLIGLKSCQVNNGKEDPRHHDLVIYCENGILGPVKELSDLYEKASGIDIKIRNDCARNLVSLLHYRDEVDIFIPDVHHAIDSLLAVDSLIFSRSVSLGEQALVFFVPQGNPDAFNGHLENLFNPDKGLILANPESSTLGLVTEIMLRENHLYEQSIKSALMLTIDSRNLTRNIAEGRGSLAIGWQSDYAAAKAEVDTVHIRGVSSHLLQYEARAAILGKAPHKKTAEHYLKWLTSGPSIRIFEKYHIKKDFIPGI